MKRIAAAVVSLLAAAALVAGCGARATGPATTQRACTLIGCDSELFVELRDKPAGTARIELCSGSRCVRTGGDGDAIALPLGRRTRGGTAPLRLEFRDRHLRVLARVRRTAELRRRQPNGPGCRPVCFSAVFTWTHGRLR